MNAPLTPASDVPPPQRPALQRFSETGQRVFQCLSLGLVVFDDQLKIVQYNPAAEFLVAGHASVADALTAVTVDAHYQNWREPLRDVVTNARQHRFQQVLYRDEEHRELLLNLLCFPITDASGNHITGGTLVIEDVTAAAGMEKRLAVSERMAAVGKLAARVAHELNNPLDGICRYLNLAIRTLDTGDAERTDKIAHYLTEARGGLMRMTDIVRQLVEFSRSTHTAFGDAGINTVVEEAVKVMTDKAVQNNVSIVCNLSENMPAIAGTNLFQVFCNLIKNAIDAMPEGGTLTVTTQLADGHTVIRFADTGPGLPAEMHRLFEPFFTTKGPGKGTGLGLAICKDIVEKYNGRIIPENRPGGGALFSVWIPLESGTRHGVSGIGSRASGVELTSPRPEARDPKPGQETP
jgi:signal transduction histidine kinase